MSAGKTVVLVGIAGTPDDFLLSPYVLKSSLRGAADVHVLSCPYVEPSEVAGRAERIAGEIAALRPGLVGFACYLWNIDAVSRIVEHVRAALPETKILLGGPEISREDIAGGRFDGSPADFLIHGEGEKPLRNLVLALQADRPMRVDDIRGLAGRRNGGFACGEPDLIERLDLEPSPYLEGAIPADLLTRPGIRANVESQRGCNFRCAYCFYHKDFPGVRYRNPETVVEEMALVDRQGIRMCRIVDANFISDTEFAKQIVRGMIRRKLRLSVFAEILPQFVDEELAGLFGEYVRCAPGNFLMLGVGLQTVNPEALTVIRRKIPLRHFERAFDLLARQQVCIKTDIILGLPRETRETYFETIEFIAEKLRHGTHFLSLAVLRVLPGSDLVGIAEREKLTLDRRDAGHFVYATPTMPRGRLIECLRLNAAAFRVLSTVHMEKGPRIRDLYFDVKDRLGVRHVPLLRHLAREFFDYLKAKGTEYVQDDFPNAEDYASKSIRTDISDDWLAGRLESLARSGLPAESPAMEVHRS